MIMKNIYKVNEETVKKIAERVYDNGSTFINRNDLEEMFPELKESEDGKIKQELIEYHKAQAFLDGKPNNKHVKFVAWLEKKIEPTDIPADAVLDGNKDGLIADTIRCKREKQDEQSPIVDKIEPKFKIGDIITNGKIIGKVDENENNKYHGWFGYDKDLNVHYSDIPDVENWHKWTIQDAKDGDVVADKSDGAIGIFQSIGHHPDGGIYNDPSYCFLHCRYDYGFFYADFEDGNTIDSDNLVPATKEQRDTLMKEMADAGYTFDFEKKELKKIEQKPTEWSEEDEKI